DAYTYNVWAAQPDDPKNPAAPFDGPQGNAFDPHPTGLPDGTQPVFTPQVQVTIDHAPFLKQPDPWLPPNSTETIGNNVEAYADFITPDGFNPTLDFHADVTGPNDFTRIYDPNVQPAPPTTGTGTATVGDLNATTRNLMKAAVTQMFYNVNFF